MPLESNHLQTSGGVTFEAARQVLEAQPFSALLGARLADIAEGSAALELDVDDRLRQHHGLLHGGVLAYAIDNVTTFAAATVLGPHVITAAIVANYLRSAREGTIRAEATVLNHTAGFAVCEASVLLIGSIGRILCATGHGTIAATRT